MSNDLGLDRSGNENHWAVNNISYADQMLDSPTNNFNVNNPLDEDYASNRVFSEGNLKVDSPTTNHGNTRGTIGMNSGKWYMEWNVPTATDGNKAVWSGVCASNNDLTAFRSVNQWNNHASNGNSIVRDQAVEDWNDSGVDAGTIWQVAVDMDNKKIWLGENNVWWGSSGHATNGNPSTAANPTATFSDSDIPDGNLYSYTGGYDLEIISNYGQDSSFAGTKTAQGNQDSGGVGDFFYTPPSGFKALCTQNLPDVDVVPSENFNTVLWTGNDTERTISGVGFQPDFTWIRNREIVTNHLLFDAVRGATNSLRSDATNAESAGNSDELLSFASDGFVIGTGEDVNGNAEGIVSWNWKANGTGSSNTSGTITTTVSANVDAGFSIITYSGNRSANQTIGHGLSKAPEMYIIKNRTKAGGYFWHVQHKDLTIAGAGGVNQVLRLNSTNAAADDWEAPIGATASVINLTDSANSDATNGTEPMLAYAWHSVDGYSKVGSYTGNGSADGPFVYTGFRPAFVLTKVINAADDWSIADYARSPHNVAGESLRPNSSSAEDSAADIDILSNGFKVRQADSHRINYDADTFIYLAFAETPFKYSNAR